MKKTLTKLKRKITQAPVILGISNKINLYRWKKKLLALPPAIVKQRKVIETATRHGIKHLIETGTYLGDMLAATKKVFSRIDSIELSAAFHKNAVRRFAKHPHVKLWNGDSAVMLADITKTAREPIVFWLDAHYSGGATARSPFGDSPIEKELDIIFGSWNPKSVILIDDARLFVGKDNYPTLHDLKAFIGKKSPTLTVEVEDDIIAIAEENR